MTDYKQLCAELVAWAEKTSAHYYSEPGVLIRARAALAEPELEDPTDADLHAMAFSYSQPCYEFEYIPFARSVLARWGK